MKYHALMTMFNSRTKVQNQKVMTLSEAEFNDLEHTKEQYNGFIPDHCVVTGLEPIIEPARMRVA